MYDSISQAAITEFASFKERELRGDLASTVQLSERELAAEFDVPGTSKGPDFGFELLKWKQSFVGKPERCYLHAALIIAIRRCIDLEENLSVFYRIWDSHEDVLLRSLDLKWLTSACDTFVDHPRSMNEQSSAMCAVILTKTVKVYETEHRLYVGPDSQRAPFRKQILFDGLLNFTVGGGDLISNLERRMRAISDATDAPPAMRIAREIFERVLVNDTAFKRVR